MVEENFKNATYGTCCSFCYKKFPYDGSDYESFRIHTRNCFDAALDACQSWLKCNLESAGIRVRDDKIKFDSVVISVNFPGPYIRYQKWRYRMVYFKALKLWPPLKHCIRHGAEYPELLTKSFWKFLREVF